MSDFKVGQEVCFYGYLGLGRGKIVEIVGNDLFVIQADDGKHTAWLGELGDTFEQAATNAKEHHRREYEITCGYIDDSLRKCKENGDA